MKVFKNILEELRDMRFYLGQIKSLLSSLESQPLKEKCVTTLVAQTPDELSRVLSEASKCSIPPLELGEYYVVKVQKRNF